MSGKDGGFPLPSVVDPDRVCVRLNIPNDPDHIAAFWGCLWLLTYWNQWHRDGAHTGTQVAAVWKDVWFEARNLNQHLDGCEIMPFDVRQNEESPCILEKTEDNVNWVTFANLQLCPPNIRLVPGGGTEISTDGGETWTPVVVEPITPREGGTDDENRCLAAANAAVCIQAGYEEVRLKYGTTANVLILAMAALTIWGFFFVFAPVIAVVLPIIAAMIAVGGFGSAVLNEDDLEAIQCILYCNSSISAGVVTFDFDQVVTEMQAHAFLPVNIAGIMLPLLGEDGLNRAGATTSITEATCECEDCPADEWCYTWIFSESDGGWVGYNFPVPAVYGSGVGWQSQYATGPGYGGTYCNIEIDVPADSVITHMSAAITLSGSYSGAGSGTWLAYVQGGVDGNFTSGAYDPPSGASELSWDGTAINLQKLRFLSQIDGSVSMTILQITVRGTGANPFGEDNC